MLMDFQTIDALLRFAISKEQASKQFYLDLSAQMTDTVARRIFQTIAGQEEKHEEALKLEMMKQGYTLSMQETDSAKSPDFDWQERLELDPETINMDYADALMVAIQKERAAFQLYAQLISMAQEPQMRQMLLELAEQEMRHVIQFEREYDAVSH